METLVAGVVIVNPLTFILPSKINFSACLREQTPALDNFFAILSHSGVVLTYYYS